MRSPMNSAACKQYIVDWYAQNDTALPLFPPALKLPVNANGGRLEWRGDSMSTKETIV